MCVYIYIFKVGYSESYVRYELECELKKKKKKDGGGKICSAMLVL